MRRQIEVDIFGQRYPISGDADEQHIRELAQYVDGKMRELAESTKALPPAKLMLLAAINITHELFQLRQERSQKEAVVDRKARDLIERIEEQFGDLKLY